MNTQFGVPLLIDGQEGIALERVPLAGNNTPIYNENKLKDLLFSYPQSLPISEIDQSYVNLVPVCREMNTDAGPIDVLYATPEGKLVILEAKLWRNPEAKRKVIGQILDYAKELGRWSYDDLQREVSSVLRAQKGQPNNLFDIVASKYPDLSESQFVDSVSRNLRRGEFLLLIVGDGIREGAAAIADFMEDHGTLHFSFGLVEMAIYKVSDEKLLIQPRVIAKTLIIKRTVITLEAEGLIARDASEVEAEAPNEMSEIQKFYHEFWTEFIGELKLDDPGQPLPNITKQGNIFLSTPAKTNAWITIYFSKKLKEVGLLLTFLRGSMGDMIYAKLHDDKESIEKELGIPVNWKSIEGKHAIETQTSFPDLYAQQYREPIKEWLAFRANIFVNVFRPRIERIIAEM